MFVGKKICLESVMLRLRCGYVAVMLRLCCSYVIASGSAPPPNKKIWIRTCQPHTAPRFYSLCRRGKYQMYIMRYPSCCRPLGADSISSERSGGKGLQRYWVSGGRTAAGLHTACHCQLYWPRRVCVVSWRSWPIYIDDPITMVSDITFVLG